MVGIFDKNRFKRIVKKMGLTQKNIADKLTDDYLVETKLDTVKSWTRNEMRNTPTTERLQALADMCNCSIQDFFSDADQKREQITNEELTSKPHKYSKSISQELNELIENFLLLDLNDQKRIIQEVKKIAAAKKQVDIS